MVPPDKSGNTLKNSNANINCTLLVFLSALRAVASWLESFSPRLTSLNS